MHADERYHHSKHLKPTICTPSDDAKTSTMIVRKSTEPTPYCTIAARLPYDIRQKIIAYLGAPDDLWLLDEGERGRALVALTLRHKYIGMLLRPYCKTRL